MVERRDLIQAVWGRMSGRARRSHHIKGLRDGIETQSGCQARIRTIRGVGYCLDATAGCDAGTAT